MKRPSALLAWSVGASLVVGVVAYRLGRARADGVPAVNPLYYGGVLSDGGRPVEGARNVTVRLWDAATAGAAVCTTTAAGTTFTGGRFRVALDTACVGAVRANPELWAEVQVEGTTFPRSKLGAVPYALEAGRASAATGALEARLAAVEGRAPERQVVIGEWTADPYMPSTGGAPSGGYGTSVGTCPSEDFQTVSNPRTLTFMARTSGLYRVYVMAFDFVRPQYLRIHSASGVAPVFPSYTRVDGVRSHPKVESIFRLEAGRTYSFVLQASFYCATGGTPPMLLISSPLIAEQMN